MLPELVKGHGAFLQAGLSLGHIDFDSGYLGDVGGDIGPVDQFATILIRKIKQGRQHSCGQLDRDAVHPIKGFPYREVIKDVDHPFSNQGLHGGQVGGCNRWGDRFSLLLMARGVHGNKILDPPVFCSGFDD